MDGDIILRRTSKPGGATPTLQRNAAYFCLSFARLSLALLFALGRVLTWLDLTCIDGQTSYIITAPSSSAITPTTATARKTIFEIKKQTTYGFYSAHYSMVIEYSSTAVVEPHEIHTKIYFTYMVMNEYNLPATKEYDITTTDSYESLGANKLRLSGCVTFYLPDTN